VSLIRPQSAEYYERRPEGDGFRIFSPWAGPELVIGVTADTTWCVCNKNSGNPVIRGEAHASPPLPTATLIEIRRRVQQDTSHRGRAGDPPIWHPSGAAPSGQDVSLLGFAADISAHRLM
jgi:hypothetical protein